MKNDAIIWIDIALDDLKSAQLLYSNGHYRNSCFLFQQASEKANKAFWLLNGVMNANEIKIIKHNQLKIFRKAMSNKKKDVEQLTQIIKQQLPKVKNHRIFSIIDLVRHNKWISDRIISHDRLQNQKFVEIKPVELNYYLRTIKEIKNAEIKIPNYTLNKFNEIMHSIADWIGQFETPEAIAGKAELLKLINNQELSNEFYKTIISELIPKLVEMAFIQMTLHFTAVITHQHSAITRYPDDGSNPIQIYTVNHPLIKRQPSFMVLLEEALNKLKIIVLN